tara:strand:- start:70 stop:258 length:189 start_codon:yes stop_codon:yes gene_type:complete
MPPEIPFLEATLEDILVLVGGVLFKGGAMEDIDVELLLRLQELLDTEIEYRMTGIPKGTQIH